MDSLGLKASGTVGSGISKSNSGSDSLLTDLNKAITTQLSENSGLSEQMSKAASQVNSDQFAQTNAFKEAASKMNQATQTMAENLSTSLSTNASANTGMTLDSRQSVNLDRFSDSIRNKNFSDDDVRNFARKNGLDENAFMDKFNSYNDTFKASTQLGSQLQRTDALVATTRDFSEQKIAIDTARVKRLRAISRICVRPPACLKGWLLTSAVTLNRCCQLPINLTESLVMHRVLIPLHRRRSAHQTM
jgi:conjugal transfer mating pair stabilization protein TraG